MEQVAGLVEFQHRRRRLAAFAKAALQLTDGAVDGAGAMDHPDMVVVVDPHADRHAHHPVIGQRLGPEWIDFEFRGHLALGHRITLESELADGECAQRGDKASADHQIPGTK